MILTDIGKFTDYVPTAAGSDLNALMPFLEESEQWLQDSLSGEDLFAMIAAMDETAALKRHTQTAVCLKAYEAAIPFLDLTQTPNGFAVVSNSNQAPASKERVERLLNFVTRRLTATMDSIINAILPDNDCRTEWKKSQAFRFRTEIVFLTAAELQKHAGNKQADYRDLETSHPLILTRQAEIAEYVSRSFLNTALRKRGDCELSEREKQAFGDIQAVTGLKMQTIPAQTLMESIVNFMISLPKEFPDYINSPEYRLKISTKYANSKEHPTFFFG
jgi:hypothetical protein